MLAVPPVEPITAATPLAFPSDAGHPQGLSSSAATRLDEFWFSEVDLAPLGLFRIIFGIELLNWFWQLLPNLGAFFTEDRMLPGATLRPLRSDASMMSGLEKLGGSPAPPRYPFSTSPTPTHAPGRRRWRPIRCWCGCPPGAPCGHSGSAGHRVVPALVTTSELQRTPDIDASSCA
jgi:hypothetical protein